MLKMCCAVGGEDRSASAGLGDLDLFCGCTATVAHRTKSHGSQDEGDSGREGRELSGWEVLL